jgi:glycerate-2-kinase
MLVVGVRLRRLGLETVIASAALSLEAAAAHSLSVGMDAVILSDSIEGEARDVGQVHAAIAREIALRDRPFTKPILLLSGGETTVTFGSALTGEGGEIAPSCCLLHSAFKDSIRSMLWPRTPTESMARKPTPVPLLTVHRL